MGDALAAANALKRNHCQSHSPNRLRFVDTRILFKMILESQNRNGWGERSQAFLIRYALALGRTRPDRGGRRRCAIGVAHLSLTSGRASSSSQAL